MNIDSSDEHANATGVKLPYFHRTLSEQDKALIGDITPKPIDLTQAATAIVQQESAGKLSTSSKWNAAMTWEERDCTTWAKDKIAEIFENGIAKSSSGFDVVILSAENIGGHAQIAHVRGKARYIYELNFSLKFHVSGGASAFDGKLEVTEVVSDMLDDIELIISWDGKSPSGATSTSVKNLLMGIDMKAAVISKIEAFEKAMREL